MRGHGPATVLRPSALTGDEILARGGILGPRRIPSVLDGRGIAMTAVIDKRVTAEIEGDFVVFLIGMRINKLWKASKWLPVFLAMPKMVRELERSPDPGSSAPSSTSAAPDDRWSSSTGAPSSTWRPTRATATQRPLARLGRLQQTRRIQRRRRHLARDLPRPRRRLRVRLQQHAAHSALAPRRDSSRPPVARPRPPAGRGYARSPIPKAPPPRKSRSERDHAHVGGVK